MIVASFPLSSVVVVGSCFFMLEKSDRAWTGIQYGALGYGLSDYANVVESFEGNWKSNIKTQQKKYNF